MYIVRFYGFRCSEGETARWAVAVISWTVVKTAGVWGGIAASVLWGTKAMAMAGQPGFFEVDERLRELSAKGEELERLNAGSILSCSALRLSGRWRARIGPRAGGRLSFTW
jgi:hypothetical protein